MKNRNIISYFLASALCLSLLALPACGDANMGVTASGDSNANSSTNSLFSPEDKQKYNHAIELMESGEFDAAQEEFESIALYQAVLNKLDEIESLRKAAREADITEIKITMDNWQDFFEMGSLEEWCENGFGEVDAFGILYYIKLKDQYKDAVYYDKSEVAVEYEYDSTWYNVDMDFENKKYKLKEKQGDWHYNEIKTIENHDGGPVEWGDVVFKEAADWGYWLQLTACRFWINASTSEPQIPEYPYSLELKRIGGTLCLLGDIDLDENMEQTTGDFESLNEISDLQPASLEEQVPTPTPVPETVSASESQTVSLSVGSNGEVSIFDLFEHVNTAPGSGADIEGQELTVTNCQAYTVTDEYAVVGVPVMYGFDMMKGTSEIVEKYLSSNYILLKADGSTLNTLSKMSGTGFDMTVRIINADSGEDPAMKQTVAECIKLLADPVFEKEFSGEETVLESVGAKIELVGLEDVQYGLLAGDAEGREQDYVFGVFRYTNLSDETKAYSNDFVISAFQNGVELDDIGSYHPGVNEKFDNRYKTVRKNGTIEFAMCYKLNDRSAVTLTAQLNGTKIEIAKEFELGDAVVREYYDINPLYGIWKDEKSGEELWLTPSAVWHKKAASSTKGVPSGLRTDKTSLYMNFGDIKGPLVISENDGKLVIENDKYRFVQQMSLAVGEAVNQEPVVISLNEQLSTDFVTIIFKDSGFKNGIEYSHRDVVSSGGSGGNISHTYIAAKEKSGSQYVYIEGKIRNLTKIKLPLSDLKGIVSINDDMNYDCKTVFTREASSITELEPMQEATILLYAEIPDSVRTSMKTADFYYGFNDMLFGTNKEDLSLNRYYYCTPAIS